MHTKILLHCAVNTDSPLSSNHSWQPDFATYLNTRKSENQKFGSTTYTEGYAWWKWKLISGWNSIQHDAMLGESAKAISFILPHSWKKIQMVETAIVIYSYEHRNQMGMEWWVNDTVGKTNVLGEIHVGGHFAQHNSHTDCPWIWTQATAVKSQKLNPSVTGNAWSHFIIIN